MNSPGHRKRSADYISSDTDVDGSSPGSSSSASTSFSTRIIAKNDAMGPHLDIGAVKEELTCNICLDLPHRVATVLPCLHSFCWVCIQEWFKTHAKCPRCAQGSSEAKPNHALTNLVQLLVKADASFGKPAEIVAQEDIAFQEYKASHGSVAKIIPGRSLYDEGTDDDDDDVAEIPPGIWPCPCCYGNNRSGFTCLRPIPQPGEAQRLAAQPLQRGEEWPELDLLAEYVSFEVMAAHTECALCSRWIPSEGVPQARCQGCSIFTCSPYDETGLCPHATRPFGPLRDHPAVIAGLESPTYATYPMAPVMWPTELARMKDYMSSRNMTARHVYDEVIAQAVTASAAPDPAAPEAAAARRCLVAPAHICSDACGPMNKAKADTILNGVFCDNCAPQGLRSMLNMWWSDIHKNQKHTLPERVRNLPDCWWGRECRTQSHKLSHAEAYNHMCENTRAQELAAEADQGGL